MGFHMLGSTFENGFGGCTCLLELSHHEKEFSQFELRLKETRIEINAFFEGRKRRQEVGTPALFEVGEAEFVVGVCIVRIKLYGIFEFDHRFGVFACRQVGIAALRMGDFFGLCVSPATID
jgi:hypothetical protein